MPLGIDRTVPTAIFEPSERIQRLRILIVDDNPAALHIISEIFRRWGMVVDTANSDTEARDMAERKARAGRAYDILLIDWNMPDIDGVQTVRDIRACAGIPVPPQVVMMTAYDAGELVHASAFEDIHGFLCKPIMPESLLRVLESLTGDPRDDAQCLIPDPVALAPVSAGGATILLVEDSAVNREIATAFLEAAGFRVEYAENGVVACAKIAKNRDCYAAVLMDVQMPEMDGITATREIRRHHPAADLPIIAMTAHAHPEERQNCLDAGMNDHLSKPIDSALLIRTLQSWIADPAAALVACAALRPLIERHSLSALAGFAALADALGLDHAARAAHPTAHALQCYDYATAAEQLDRIELHARMDAAA